MIKKITAKEKIVELIDFFRIHSISAIIVVVLFSGLALISKEIFSYYFKQWIPYAEKIDLKKFFKFDSEDKPVEIKVVNTPGPSSTLKFMDDQEKSIENIYKEGVDFDNNMGMITNNFISYTEIQSILAYTDSKKFEAATSALQKSIDKKLKDSTFDMKLRNKILSKAYYVTAIILISMALNENEEQNKINIIVRASQVLINSLELDGSNCPSAHMIRELSQLSAQKKLKIIDQDYFFKHIALPSKTSLINEYHTCAYLYDAYLLLSISAKSEPDIDRVVELVHDRTDWAPYESIRIFLYMRALDGYIALKDGKRIAFILGEFDRIANIGIEIAEIFKIYIISLNLNFIQYQEKLSDILYEIKHIEDYKKITTTIPQEQIYGFHLFNHKIVEKYISEIKYNTSKIK